MKNPAQNSVEINTFTQDSEKELAIKCGFDSFLNKPISLAELSAGIAALVEEKQPPAIA
jgi:DNA-binding response OmpR family regulator